MRIELPNPTWADAAQRAHDDAHTLTMPEGARPWLEPWCEMEEPRSVRVEIATVECAALTITF